MALDGSHSDRKADSQHAILGIEEAYILGYNVERLRKLANLDIATFSRMSNISRPTLYKIESGESNLRLSNLKKIADALGVSIPHLLTLPHESVDVAFCRRHCNKNRREGEEWLKAAVERKNALGGSAASNIDAR